MRIIIFGANHQENRLQATSLAQNFSIPAISIADTFLEHINDHTDIGKETTRYVSEGNPIPEVIISRAVQQRLSEDDANDGFVLTGFPRTMAHALTLENVLNEQMVQLNAVIFIDSDTTTPKCEQNIARLSHRNHSPTRFSEESEELLNFYAPILVRARRGSSNRETSGRILSELRFSANLPSQNVGI